MVKIENNLHYSHTGFFAPLRLSGEDKIPQDAMTLR